MRIQDININAKIVWGKEFEKMENVIAILLVIFGMLFLIGIASGIVSVVFTKKGKHPVLAIVLSLITWLTLCIPVKYILGFGIYRVALVVMGIFSITIIIQSIKNIRKNKA